MSTIDVVRLNTALEGRYVVERVLGEGGMYNPRRLARDRTYTALQNGPHTMTMTMTKPALIAAVAAVLASPLSLSAQNPLVESLQGLFDVTKTNIMATAEMLDDEMYAYRPTAEVRSTAELLAHIANAQFSFCSGAAREANPNSENFEETRTGKGEIIEALERGFGYCERVFGRTTDAGTAGAADLFDAPNTVGGILAFNSAHNYEHYGNLVTYMRLNGIVPPSSM